MVSIEVLLRVVASAVGYLFAILEDDYFVNAKDGCRARNSSC